MDDAELVKRFKAAVAYAGVSVPKLAELVADEGGLSASTLYDVQQGRRPRSPLLSPGERAAIARACELPEAFFTADFDVVFGREHDPMAEFDKRLRRLEAAQGAPAPPGELGRRAGVNAPIDERQGQGGNHAEEDRQSGGEG